MAWACAGAVGSKKFESTAMMKNLFMVSYRNIGLPEAMVLPNSGRPMVEGKMSSR